MTLTLLPSVPPAITFTVETRPSVGTGFSWWGVLHYRGVQYLELLPHDLPAMDEAKRDEVIGEALARLKEQLAPVLRAEDGQEPQGACPHCGAGILNLVPSDGPHLQCGACDSTYLVGDAHAPPG